MRVGPNRVITLAYRVQDSDGNLLDGGDSPLVYLHGGYDGLFPRLEAELDGKEVGEEIDVRLQPNEAFGEYDAELITVEPLDSFPESIEVGMMFERSSDDGDDQLCTITDIVDDSVVVDANHPWAGVGLRFFATVADVREATSLELRAGEPSEAELLLH